MWGYIRGVAIFFIILIVGPICYALTRSDMAVMTFAAFGIMNIFNFRKIAYADSVSDIWTLDNVFDVPGGGVIGQFTRNGETFRPNKVYKDKQALPTYCIIKYDTIMPIRWCFSWSLPKAIVCLIISLLVSALFTVSVKLW